MYLIYHFVQKYDSPFARVIIESPNFLGLICLINSRNGVLKRKRSYFVRCALLQTHKSIVSHELKFSLNKNKESGISFPSINADMSSGSPFDKVRCLNSIRRMRGFRHSRTFPSWSCFTGARKLWTKNVNRIWKDQVHLEVICEFNIDDANIFEHWRDTAFPKMIIPKLI